MRAGSIWFCVYLYCYILGFNRWFSKRFFQFQQRIKPRWPYLPIYLSSLCRTIKPSNTIWAIQTIIWSCCKLQRSLFESIILCRRLCHLWESITSDLWWDSLCFLLLRETVRLLKEQKPKFSSVQICRNLTDSFTTLLVSQETNSFGRYLGFQLLFVTLDMLHLKV